jgi:RNA polymerase sigma factor (sigma-70 family)
VPPRTALTDEDLLASHETDDFAIFYDRHVRTMLGYFQRRTGDPQVAADLTAETFAAALEAKHRFRAGGPPARAWLFGIARKKLVDFQRRGHAEDRARRRLGMERIEPTEDDLRRIGWLAGGVEVASIVDELPSEQRHAVTARVVAEREYADIAGELQISEAGVRQRVSRGLAALRRRLREGQ